MAKAKWKRFEDLAAEIQRQLAPTATVAQNEKIPGRRTGRLRDVDISVRQKVGQYDILVAIDCKDYRRKINVKDIEGFMGLAEDVGANQAAMIAARGFSSTAKKRAADAGVGLFRLIDAEDHDWKSYVSIPAVAELLEITAFSLSFSGTGPFVLAPQDFRLMSLCRADGSLIDVVSNLLLERWDADQIPEDAGEHEDISLTDEETFVKTDGRLYRINVAANVIVERRLYFGQLPLVEVRGFADEIKGGMVTTGFRTDRISVEGIQQSWTQIESRESLAVEPVVSFGLKVTMERIRPAPDAA
jgi:hypothetical protein